MTNVDHAEKAFEAINEERPEVILMDLVLPGMDGLELTRLLKKDSDTRSIPGIAPTSYLDRFPRALVLSAGCDAYVVKTIKTRPLPIAVARTIAGTNG